MVILSGQGLGARGNYLVPWRPGMPWRGFAVARAAAGSTTVDARMEGVVQLKVTGVFSPAQNGRVVYALDDARYSLTEQAGAMAIGRVLLTKVGAGRAWPSGRLPSPPTNGVVPTCDPIGA